MVNRKKTLIFGIRNISGCEMDTETQLYSSPLTPVDKVGVIPVASGIRNSWESGITFSTVNGKEGEVQDLGRKRGKKYF